MRLYTVLIKPVSGQCNMQCDYCFYCDEMKNRSTASYGRMSEQTLRKVIRRAMRQAGEEICFAFQGGEPTLRGLDFYSRAIELEERFNTGHTRVLNSIQTNGLALDEEWCRFFREHDFLVGVSLDGTKRCHDMYRHDSGGGGTYRRVTESIKLLEEFGVRFNILTVVTAQTAEHIEEIYGEYRKNGWQYQQYIACLDPIGAPPGQQDYSLTPEAYGRFLTKLFRMWHKDWRRGKAPYIRQFENYIGMLNGYAPESCEQCGVCSVQCVAEADGSAYPCDFYVLDEYRLGDYGENDIRQMTECAAAKAFVRRSLNISAECRACEWYSLCRCGCQRCRIRDGEKDGYINSLCGGYRMFFDKCGRQLQEIAQYSRSVKV